MLTDAEAIDRIHRLIDGTDWSIDHLQWIAEILELAGRKVRPPVMGAEAGPPA